MNDNRRRWVEEFREEIEHDHRELLSARQDRQGQSTWSFDHAVDRTRQFYRERVTGFAHCRSISETEREQLLRLVETLATTEFSNSA